MVSNNPFTKLKDICVKITKGSTPTKKDGGFAERGINFIKAESSSYDGVFDDSKFTFVTEEVYEKYKRSQLEKNDILFSMAGAYLGKTGFVEKKHLPANTNQALALIRVDSTLANPKFVLYCLQQRRVVHFVNNSISQSAQPNINLQQIGDLDIDFPDRKVQDSIVNIIDSIVQRSLNNHYTNQTLEQIAQTLFKSWFVDFDPVFDNALAAGSNVSDFPEALQQRALLRQERRKQAQQLAASPKTKSKPLPEDIRSLFPSEFEQTEEPNVGIGGWIPKGWEIVELADVTTELRRGISPKYLEEGGIQVINQKCIRNHEVNFTLCRRNNPEIRKVTGRELLLGDLLVNSTGVGTLGRMAQVNSLPEPTVVDSHVTVVRPDIAKCPAHTFGQLMLAIERRVEALGEGSTGQTELSRKILSEQKVILPPIAIASRIEETFKSYAEKQVSNSIQITTLEKLRDTLLPKLISGELTIPDSIKTENIVNHQQPKEPLSHHA
jgi:type I restriction enzyme S subunit